jgi:hypothetical protein
MKAISLRACLGMAVLCISTAMAQSSKAPFSVVATAPHSEVKSGEEVYLKVRLTNESSRLAVIEFTSPLCDYAVEVRDNAGNLMPDSDAKSKLDCARGDSGSDRIIQLKPSESVTNTISIGMFSYISRPGVYFVQVAWRMPKVLGDTPVRSNSVRITVTP